MSEGKDLSTLHFAMAGYHRIPKKLSVDQAKFRGTVGYKRVYLLEGTFVHEQSQPLSGRQFATAMLLVDSLLASAFPSLRSQLFKRFKLLVDDSLFSGHYALQEYG